MAASKGVLRGHVRREQGMSSAFAVSIEGSDSCFESHHLMWIASHGQSAFRMSRGVEGSLCHE